MTETNVQQEGTNVQQQETIERQVWDGEPQALARIAAPPAARQIATTMPVSDRLPANWWQYDSAWAQIERLCRTLASSHMVPEAYRGKPGNVFVALTAGMPLGLSPLASLQSTAVINGRPTLFGDAPLAICLAHPSLVLHEHEKHGTIEDETRQHVYRVVRRIGTHEVVTEDAFSIDDAKRAGLWGKAGPWKQYPDRMLLARAKTYCLRNAFPDVLAGLQVEADAADETPAPIVLPLAMPQAAPLSATVPAKPGVVDSPGYATEAKQAAAQPAAAKPAPKPKVVKAEAAQEVAELDTTAKDTAAAEFAAATAPVSAAKSDLPDVLLAGDLIEPKVPGTLRYHGANLGFMVWDGADWIDLEADREQSEQAYETACKVFAAKLTRRCIEARRDRMGAMAWAQEQLGLTAKPASFTALTLDQLVALHRS